MSKTCRIRACSRCIWPIAFARSVANIVGSERLELVRRATPRDVVRRGRGVVTQVTHPSSANNYLVRSNPFSMRMCDTAGDA